MKYAIKVVWADGSEEYLKQGATTTTFSTRARANEQRAFMMIGMEGDPEVQSVSVVATPHGTEPSR